MPENIRLIVTERVIRPGREFRAGEVILEAVAPAGVTLAHVNRLISMGRVHAMNFNAAGATSAPPPEHQEPPPPATREVVNDPAAEAALREAVAKDEAARAEPEPEPKTKKRRR